MEIPVCIMRHADISESVPCKMAFYSVSKKTSTFVGFLAVITKWLKFFAKILNSYYLHKMRKSYSVTSNFNTIVPY